MLSNEKTVEMTVALPMRTLGREMGAIRNKLQNLISTHMPEIDGVLMGWSDLKILSDKGQMIDEQPYTFWRIQFQAQVFQAADGKLVKGKVHSMMKSYFIVKALNSFTVTININDQYKDHKAITGLMIDQEVYFKMISCADGKWRGELDEECLELTSNLRDQEIDTEKDVYEYAKNFEY